MKRGFSWGKHGRVGFPFSWRSGAPEPELGVALVRTPGHRLDASKLDLQVIIREAGLEVALNEGDSRLTQQIDFVIHRAEGLLRIRWNVDHASCDGITLLPVLSRLAETLGLVPARPTLVALENPLACMDEEDESVESTWFHASDIELVAARLGEALDLELTDYLLLFLLTYDLNATTSQTPVRHGQNRLRFSPDLHLRLRLQRGASLGLSDVVRLADGDIPETLRGQVARTGQGRDAARAFAKAAVSDLITRFRGEDNLLNLVRDGLRIPAPLRDRLEPLAWGPLFWGNVHLTGRFLNSIIPERIPKWWFPDFGNCRQSDPSDWRTDFGGHHIAGPALSEQALQIAASSCSKVRLDDGHAIWVVQTKINPAVAARRAGRFRPGSLPGPLHER
jgi:hypothetical protein